jgi:glutamyl-tRNA synthetase/glutamyl-Q tRNA(Asp) synthetase
VLHLAYVWGISKVLDARRILRIEDHDQSRCRPAYELSIQADLEWLGLVSPDETLMVPRQSQRLGRYEEVLGQLQERGLVYACVCSRKTILQSQSQTTLTGLPMESEICYQGTCRKQQIPLDTPSASLRLRWPDEDAVRFCDLRHGDMVQFPSKQCGDMVLRDRLGQYTYQFAVVVDDWDQGVNLIIRGDDLLESVGRQLLLRKILGDSSDVVTYHHPLLYDDQQQKLSKRLKSQSLETLKSAGLSAEDVFGQALSASGLEGRPRPFTLAEIENLFK